jgi:hypothetical protein
MKRDRDTAGIDVGETELGPKRPPNPGPRYAHTTLFFTPSKWRASEPMEVDVKAGSYEEEPMLVDEGYATDSDMEIDGEEEDILSPSFRRLSVSN